ncbi:MAG: PRC-barrel domain-containing protein, partial [Methyloligellaceae bacterium]
DKTVLGEVVAVQNFGSGDLLEVRLTESSKTVLIPFTEAVVPTVDIAAGEVLIVPPEGLLD